MKYIFVIIFSAGFGIKSFGQSVEPEPKLNSWRTMVGYSHYGGGDITGITVMNEYNRYLTPHIRVAPNFKFSSANRIDYFSNGLNNQEPSFISQQATIFEFGAMGYYEYLNPNRAGLELGVGFFYRNLQRVTTVGPNVEFIDSNIRLQENSTVEYPENTVGFNVSIGFIIPITEIISFNINGLVQSDTGSNTGFGGLGGLSIKF